MEGHEHSAHFKAVTALKALYDLVFVGFATGKSITQGIQERKAMFLSSMHFSVFLPHFPFLQLPVIPDKALSIGFFGR